KNMNEVEYVDGDKRRKEKQKIELDQKESIHLTMIDGPLRGSREIKLVPLEAKRTKIDVSWDIQFSAIPDFAQGFVRARLEEGTREALDRIAKAAQARRG